MSFDYFLRRILQLLLLTPVVIVCSIIFLAWYVFIFVFQARRLIGDYSSIANAVYGAFLIFLFSLNASMVLMCYLKCITTSNAVSKNPPPPSFPVDSCPRCRRCSSLKPRRAHHCSVCNECVLKMDHHCPWVANCVGFKNYKFFVLFVSYACVGCLLYIIGIIDQALHVVVQNRPDNFLILLASIMMLAFGITLIPFSWFHIHLVMTGRTTLEYGYLSSPNLYDKGTMNNIELVFGRNQWLWIIPVDSSDDTGWDLDPENIEMNEMIPMFQIEDSFHLET